MPTSTSRPLRRALRTAASQRARRRARASPSSRTPCPRAVIGALTPCTTGPQSAAAKPRRPVSQRSTPRPDGERATDFTDKLPLTPVGVKRPSTLTRKRSVAFREAHREPLAQAECAVGPDAPAGRDVVRLDRAPRRHCRRYSNTTLCTRAALAADAQRQRARAPSRGLAREAVVAGVRLRRASRVSGTAARTCQVRVPEAQPPTTRPPRRNVSFALAVPVPDVPATIPRTVICAARRRSPLRLRTVVRIRNEPSAAGVTVRPSDADPHRPCKNARTNALPSVRVRTATIVSGRRCFETLLQRRPAAVVGGLRSRR